MEHVRTIKVGMGDDGIQQILTSTIKSNALPFVSP